MVNRGVGYGDGKIIVNALDGQVIALDMNSGKPVWTVHNGDPAMGQTLTSAPLIVKDKLVMVGVSGGEFGVRGYLSAYDIKNGKRVWRAYSAGPDSDTLIGAGFSGPKNAGRSTWNGEQWKVGGGTTWGWYSYDPKLNSIYYGTGNPGTWNPSQRPGDNKWSMTIFARDADTGMAKWGYQMTPHDAWDYDGVNEMILVDLNMNGQTIPSLVHFDRNGFAYELDRRNGKLLLAKKFDPSVNWATHVDMTSGRPVVDPRYMTKAGINVSGICPAAMGSKDQQPASYDEESGYFIVPTNHNCMDYKAFAVKYKSGFPFVGAIVKMYPGPGGNRGAVIAWDPIKGEVVWTDKERFPAWGGTLTTKGGVAFYGTMDGWFKAVDAKTGKELWKFHTPSGIIGNPITYTHGGKQYVAILSGVGGWAALGTGRGPHRADRGPGRRERRAGPQELHAARRRPGGILALMTLRRLAVAAAFAARRGGGYRARPQPRSRCACCADPDYMPFSNRAGQGFENKLAQAVGARSASRSPTCGSSMRGPGGFDQFLHDTLNAERCDVVMNVPYASENVLVTRPVLRLVVRLRLSRRSATTTSRRWTRRCSSDLGSASSRTRRPRRGSSCAR